MDYQSSHRILLVGEGDLSFSLSLARSFGTALNIVATTLDSRLSLITKYASALSNLAQLESLGCTILHEVDVHTMSQHPRLMHTRFHRIIFNFPHAGFICRESDAFMIQLHQNLVSGFLSNAKQMIYGDGEIHITHKTTGPFSMWDIEKLGEIKGLILREEEEFYQWAYLGYKNKRGSGRKCDKSFPIGKSSTFKFAFYKCGV
ncbi:uncharacterized protein At4g26485-like [Lotus japonicus]|uniref:uncharacterized protein At4g26485-like n=1 Tax=Lotus japonicus TaxID=34305 RepID=UPI002586F929|nr:uncharacterized protein At4g26485-like [Lotus japonicus]